ncbi:MAG: hypothetical protein K6T66_12930 [Peptococcaceae bacterium]|nr:hypothetical protein [Peptococcaceae bacterium]
MYGDRHPLTRKTSPDKFIFGLTFTQLLAVLIGGKLSCELAGVVPALPIDNFLLRHVHQGIPLYLAGALVFLEDSVTGRVAALSLFDRLSARFRRRVFLYRREE